MMPMEEEQKYSKLSGKIISTRSKTYRDWKEEYTRIVSAPYVSGDRATEENIKSRMLSRDLPGPETKLAITRSSSDKVKASNQPEMIAGMIIGSVMTKNTFSGVAAMDLGASPAGRWP